MSGDISEIGWDIGKIFLFAVLACAFVVAWIARRYGRKAGLFVIAAGALLVVSAFLYLAMPIEPRAFWFTLGWVLQVQAPFLLAWILVGVIAMEVGWRSRRWLVRH